MIGIEAKKRIIDDWLNVDWFNWIATGQNEKVFDNQPIDFMYRILYTWFYYEKLFFENFKKLVIVQSFYEIAVEKLN
jgi:hypothetical protein